MVQFSLRHCRTSREFADSISDGIIDIILPARTSAMGSTQPLTKVGMRTISWDKGGRSIGLTNLPHSCADFLEILEASVSWSPESMSRPLME